MLYLFEISKKWAFRICMGWGGGGGGVGDHIFSEIRAEVGRFHDFGLSVHRWRTSGNFSVRAHIRKNVVP